jgi:hypothetical protein
MIFKEERGIGKAILREQTALCRLLGSTKLAVLFVNKTQHCAFDKCEARSTAARGAAAAQRLGLQALGANTTTTQACNLS